MLSAALAIALGGMLVNACINVPRHPLHKRSNASASWNLDQFTNLLTFGDSYTDEQRLGYFGSHNGNAPPPGTVFPESLSTSSGGRIWARYVIQYTGSEADAVFTPHLSLYDYAVSGAVCSNAITPRVWLADIGFDFPAVIEYEVPAFVADQAATNPATGAPTFTPPLTAANAVYVVWIGTNDLGVNAFLTDSQVTGKTLTDYTDCVFAALDGLYAAGGRYFVVHNVLPLWLTELYGRTAGPNRYWPDKPSNVTEISYKMQEYATTVNNVYKYEIPNDVVIANRYPGASFALYDVYQLVLDIYDNPTVYLNGSAPANVTGFSHQCDGDGANCVDAPSPDSFLWYDELHPSEQTDRVIAREFVHVLSGNSTYATYY